MITVETQVKVPFLWGKTVFKKSHWNQVNLIVGPNGSGKTVLAQELVKQFKKSGYEITYLQSDRAEKEDFLKKLKKDPQLRKKIDGVLLELFGKSLSECHGLKQIIMLLVALYSPETKCLFVDEPELHLHPQFQQFFMNEIRKTADADPTRIFFLITHSPYFIDLRYAEDLVGVVVCHVNRAPTSIEELSTKDEMLFRRFLPRFNTYHKQFFFSDNQIFVEGYTDQQIFTHLLNCIENKYGAAGTGVIDVGGKDELGVFFKVCSLLGTDGRIITDLDSLFAGKLRDVVCDDERPASWLNSQVEKQMPFYRMLFTTRELETPITLEKLIRRLEKYLTNIGKCVAKLEYPLTPDVELYSEKIRALYEKYEKPESLDTFKTVVLQGIIELDEQLKDVLPIPLAQTVPLILNLANMILASIEAARVYILPKGCIEHFYRQTNVQYMPVSGKDRLFHAEIEYMMELSVSELKTQYPELVAILTRACFRTGA